MTAQDLATALAVLEEMEANGFVNFNTDVATLHDQLARRASYARATQPHDSVADRLERRLDGEVLARRRALHQATMRACERSWQP